MKVTKSDACCLLLGLCMAVTLEQNYHFHDKKYEEKIERPIKSCEVFIPVYREAGLTGSPKWHKKQRKEENMETTPRVYG